MSARQVGLIINSGSFQHQLSVRRKAYEEDHDQKLAEDEVTASSILKEAGCKAATTLVLGLQSQSEAHRLRSAESILDRTGTVKVTRQESNDNPVVSINREDLQLLKETLELEQQLTKRIKCMTVNTPDDTKKEGEL